MEQELETSLRLELVMLREHPGLCLLIFSSADTRFASRLD